MSAASQPEGETLSSAPAEPAARLTEGQPLLDTAIQTILDQARERRRRDAEAQCAQLQAEARLRRAADAWDRVAFYGDDAIPRGLTSAERRHGYAEVIVALGRVLAADGWRERLETVRPGPDAKTYSVALLRRAMDGDLAAVETMIHWAIDTLGQLGLAADTWLREGLRYEVLGIRPPPELPRGWEGPYLKSIETVADLVAWIDQEFLIQDLLGKGRGKQPSDGRLVRNAFRLVTKLGLTGLPPEPLGPWKLHDELAVLRNLRRWCLPLVGGPADGGTPASRSCPDEDDEEEEVAGGDVRIDVAEGETAEELVQNCLADHPIASREDVTKATGLSSWKVLRTQAWKDHEERQLDAYLRQHSEAHTSDVQNAFGLSRSKIVTTRAWKAHRAREEAARSRRRVESKERPLTEAMVDCRPDESALDPSARVSQREQIFRAVLEQADTHTRAKLNGLRSAERDALVDHLLQSMDDEGWEGREPATTVAILVVSAQSWLEDWEQRRHRKQCP